METDAAFLLRVLQDGRWHSLDEILEASFVQRGCRLTVHSRTATLRARGHVVENEVRRNGRRAQSFYRLVKPESVFTCTVDESAGLAEIMASPDMPLIPANQKFPEQLALTDSAAAHIYRDMAGTPL